MSARPILQGSSSLSAKGLEDSSKSLPVVPRVRDYPVACTVCGGALSFLADSFPFTYGCARGHYLTIQDLLDAVLPTPGAPEATLTECWERKAGLLRQLARRALQVGHIFTAADFQDVANRIDRWLVSLRNGSPAEDIRLLISG